MKRSPIKRKPFRRTTKPRTPQQLRKQAEDAEYLVNREARLVQARGRCEFEWDGVRCTRVATQTHHVRRRSNHVDHSVENLKSCCLWCHQRAHLNVKVAKEMGWIKAEWPQIGELPMER